jgi:hypothetical protein
MKPERGELAMNKFALIIIGLVILLPGCERGNAELGPNPGGGFYSPSNIDNGRINP